MKKTEWKELVSEIQEKNTEISKSDIKKAIKKAYKKAAKKGQNQYSMYKEQGLDWDDLSILEIRDLIDKYIDFDKEEKAQDKYAIHLAPAQKTNSDNEPTVDITEEVQALIKPTEELSLEAELKQKIDNKEPLTERELKSLLDFEIEREEKVNLRWTRSVSSIIELCNEYYELDWFEGLTEMQENEFYDQPYRVRKQEVTKTITVTEWIRNDYDFEEEQEDEMDLE